MALLAAQQYYVEYSQDFNVDRLGELLPTYIPDFLLQSGRQSSPANKNLEKWLQMVMNAYKKVWKS